MNALINVLIAAGRDDYIAALESCLTGDSSVNIIGATGDGDEALRIINESVPEFLVTDTASDGTDVVDLIRHLMDGGVPAVPIVIAAGLGQSREMDDLVFDAGDGAFIYSSPDITQVADLISTVTEDILAPIKMNEYYPHTPEELIDRMLRDIGASPRTKGFRYLASTACTAAEKGDKNIPLTKYLYPETADRFNTTGSAVERLMRHTVESIWKDKNDAALMHYLKMNTYTHPDKPTNSEFIFAMVRYVKERMGER